MLAMYRHNETRLTAGLPLENFQLPCQVSFLKKNWKSH